MRPIAITASRIILTATAAFLRDRDNNYLLTDAGSLQRCPRCGNRRIAGAGSFVEIPIPSSGDGGGSVPDLRSPVQMLTVDSASLSFNVEEAQRLAR